MSQPIIDVRSCCGRYCLFIAGFAVAMEGDPCRESGVVGRSWTEESLREAVDKINNTLRRERAGLAERIRALKSTDAEFSSKHQQAAYLVGYMAGKDDAASLIESAAQLAEPNGGGA